MTRTLTEFLVGVLFLAIIYSLVRPGSPAANVVQTISTALVAVVGSATGYNQSGGPTV